MSVGIDADMKCGENTLKERESYGQLDKEIRKRNDIEQTDDRKNLCFEAKNLISTLSGIDEAARNLRNDEIDNFDRATAECAQGKTIPLEELKSIMADSKTENLWSALDYLAAQTESTIGALSDCIQLINNEKETSHGE